MSFITQAFADTAAGAAPAASGMQTITQMAPLLLIGVVFYMFMVRPQQKQARETKAMLAGIRRGDKILTKAGILAKVIRVQDKELTIEIAEGVRIQIIREAIDRVLARTEPVGKDSGSDKGGDGKDEADDVVKSETAEPAEPATMLTGLKKLLGGK